MAGGAQQQTVQQSQLGVFLQSKGATTLVGKTAAGQLVYRNNAGENYVVSGAPTRGFVVVTWQPKRCDC